MVYGSSHCTILPAADLFFPEHFFLSICRNSRTNQTIPLSTVHARPRPPRHGQRLQTVNLPWFSRREPRFLQPGQRSFVVRTSSGISLSDFFFLPPFQVVSLSTSCDVAVNEVQARIAGQYDQWHGERSGAAAILFLLSLPNVTSLWSRIMYLFGQTPTTTEPTLF